MTHMSMASKSSGKGGVDGGASALRSALTAGLQEHVYLAGIAVENGVTHGLTSPQFKAAATLDKNSVALSQAIQGVYGQQAGAAFLKLWRAHIGFFVDYTKGRATKDPSGTSEGSFVVSGQKRDAVRDRRPWRRDSPPTDSLLVESSSEEESGRGTGVG